LQQRLYNPNILDPFREISKPPKKETEIKKSAFIGKIIIRGFL